MVGGRGDSRVAEAEAETSTMQQLPSLDTAKEVITWWLN